MSSADVNQQGAQFGNTHPHNEDNKVDIENFFLSPERLLHLFQLHVIPPLLDDEFVLNPPGIPLNVLENHFQRLIQVHVLDDNGNNYSSSDEDRKYYLLTFKQIGLLFKLYMHCLLKVIFFNYLKIPL